MEEGDAEPMQIDILEDVLLADDDEANQNQANAPPIANLGGGVNRNDGGLPGVITGMLGAAGGGGTAGDGDFQVENPTLDLDSYAASYKGMAKLLRLIHIADHCPSLKSDAIKLALKTVVSKTYNVELYQALHKKIRGDGGGGDAVAASATTFPPIDANWIEVSSKRAAVQLEKLDSELKIWKANSIKESIRRGMEELGEFYIQCGDLTNALKSFTRSRDYCTSAQTLVQMCVNIIKVSIYLQNWAHVSNYVLKAENTPNLAEEKKASAKELAATTSKLKCAAGLAELAGKKYKAAADHFLSINFDSFDCPEIVSQGDVAIYAGLCALATFDRSELQKSVLGSLSFKQFLELEPPVRDVLHSFHASNYGKCNQLLHQMRENLLLDIYLAPHVSALYSQIRQRGMIQYFAPYATADMVRMAAAFNTSVPQLEDELMVLILSGDIEARIDSQNKVLVVRQKDARAEVFEKTLRLGAEYERNCKLMVLRSLMVKSQLCVKHPPPEGGQSGQGQGRGGGGVHFNIQL